MNALLGIILLAGIVILMPTIMDRIQPAEVAPSRQA
jgi:hypothetical protein